MEDRNPDKGQRRLIQFPILHTAADLGTLAESVNRAAKESLGLDGARRKIDLIHSIWTEIEQFFTRTPLPYPDVKLYQDGLPVCGMEANIVSDLARNGSRNHRLLLRLMRKGARLMGTESPELLIEEHTLMQKLLADASRPSGAAATPGPSTAARELLIKRDQFIAGRIDATLGNGEVGILFLGLLHDIGPHLSEDIHSQYPLHKFSINTKAG